MSCILSTDKVSKQFGETKALQNVSVHIQMGKVYTILGENGSGKSTLVKVLSGVLVPDTGEIYIDSQKTSAKTPSQMIANGVTVVLQEVLIAGNLSGLDNMFIGQDSLFSYAHSPQKRREIAKYWVQKLSHSPIDLDKPARKLSLNEQQVLVIARGFMMQTRVLILDEITAALDLADRTKVFNAIGTYCKNGGAVVFVSHRMPEIIELSDAVFIMHNGKHTATVTGADITPETLLTKLTLGDNAQ